MRASLAAIFAGYVASAQTTLDECIGLAYDNHPQIREMSLIETTKDIDLRTAAFAWLPHLNISGKATWQSEVVEIPIEIPGMDINIPHDQYGLHADERYFHTDRVNAEVGGDDYLCKSAQVLCGCHALHLPQGWRSSGYVV